MVRMLHDLRIINLSERLESKVHKIQLGSNHLFNTYSWKLYIQLKFGNLCFFICNLMFVYQCFLFGELIKGM